MLALKRLFYIYSPSGELFSGFRQNDVPEKLYNNININSYYLYIHRHVDPLIDHLQMKSLKPAGQLLFPQASLYRDHIFMHMCKLFLEAILKTTQQMILFTHWCFQDQRRSSHHLEASFFKYLCFSITCKFLICEMLFSISLFP